MFNELNLPIYETIGEYTQDQLNLMVNEIKKRHREIIGIPMLKELHKLFHSIYGYDEDVSIEDVYDFKKRYLNGEFNNLIK